jgi:hypothetical protein
LTAAKSGAVLPSTAAANARIAKPVLPPSNLSSESAPRDASLPASSTQSPEPSYWPPLRTSDPDYSYILFGTIFGIGFFCGLLAGAAIAIAILIPGAIT